MSKNPLYPCTNLEIRAKNHSYSALLAPPFFQACYDDNNLASAYDIVEALFSENVHRLEAMRGAARAWDCDTKLVKLRKKLGAAAAAPRSSNDNPPSLDDPHVLSPFGAFFFVVLLYKSRICFLTNTMI